MLYYVTLYVAMWTSLVCAQELVCIRQVGTCACETAQGWINLDPLDSKDKNNPSFQDIQDYNGDTYSYNPCTDFSYGGCSEMAACQTKRSVGYPLGNQASAKFGNDPTYGDLTVTYTGTGNDGKQRQAVVTLTCDQNQEGNLQANGEYPTGVYDLTLTSKYACVTDVPPSDFGGSGLSAGSILLIIFFTLIAVYLVAGILFNKFAKGAEGKEMVPQVAFWTGLPGLALDGVQFTIGKAMQLCGKETLHTTV